MDYERYERFFVLLNGQNEAFSMRSGAEMRGHIKIETGNRKGAMRIGVQNVRCQERGEYEYKLILFGEAQGETLYAVIGNVNVNRMGSGETYFRFDPLSVDAEGHCLADFSHAVVAAASLAAEDEPLCPVLKGQIPALPAEESDAVYAAGKTDTAGSEADGAAKRRDAAGGATEKAGTMYGAAETQDTAYAEDAPRCFNSYYNKYVAAQCYRLERDRNAYDRVAPFREDVTGAEWTKMTQELRLPLVSPDAQRLAAKYRHYIFGTGARYYYLGVPGRFLRAEQPESGKSGFTLWQPIIGAEEYHATEENTPEEVRKMAYGYWIIAVDRENGDIVEA